MSKELQNEVPVSTVQQAATYHMRVCDLRISRSLLSWMCGRTSSQENFSYALAPNEFEMPGSDLLKQGLERVLQKVNLLPFASVVIENDGKVSVTIASKDIAAHAAQAAIRAELTLTEKAAAQLQI